MVDSPSGNAIAASGVRAGEWDDNANYREFLKLLASRPSGTEGIDVRDRQIIVVRDSDGRAVPQCKVRVQDGVGHDIVLTTLSNGRATLFPHGEGLTSPDLRITAACGQSRLETRATVVEGEGVINVMLPAPRALPARPSVELAFILDTTGSMSEEIAAVKETLVQVAAQLDSLGADIRVGMVAFKDHGDSYVTKVYPFSSDLEAFIRQTRDVAAQGGGDMPEAVNEGIEVAVKQLDWQPQGTVRLAFLIGDAPPHVGRGPSYAASARAAVARGIQIHTIAASGMDNVGQLVWRQVAQYTGGAAMFVLRGGAGPQSVGGGDPLSSCGGTQTQYASGNLHELVLAKIQAALAGVDADPGVIPGLGQDESAKPCAERAVAGPATPDAAPESTGTIAK
jgi:Mg-chelatase subunit ChlD